MSSSKLISGEALTAYQRWELPNVQPPPKGSHVENLDAGGPLTPLTAEQLEKIHQDAYREGFDEGRKEGRAAGQKDVAEAAQRLRDIVEALAEPLNAVDESVEQELMDLSIAVAQQIIRREIRTEPGEIVAVVREALSVLPSAARRVHLMLNPEDAALVRENLPSQAPEQAHWRIIEDGSVTRGGCRVSAEHSQIDATVENRIAVIAAKLLGGERRDDAKSD